MKKIILILLTAALTFSLIGCEDEVIIEEYADELSVEEYYDIIKNTLLSDMIGEVEGFSSSVMGNEFKPFINDFEGEIKAGYADIEILLHDIELRTINRQIDLTESFEEMIYPDYENYIISNTKKENADRAVILNTGYNILGAKTIFDLDTKKCNVKNYVMTCTYETLDENKLTLEDGEESQNLAFSKEILVFEFDKETNELDEYNIDYINYNFFVPATIESEKNAETSTDMYVILEKDEYTKLAKDLIDYSLNNVDIMTSNDVERKLKNYVMDKYGVTFSTVYFYTSEEVEY